MGSCGRAPRAGWAACRGRVGVWRGAAAAPPWEPRRPRPAWTARQRWWAAADRAGRLQGGGSVGWVEVSIRSCYVPCLVGPSGPGQGQVRGRKQVVGSSGSSAASSARVGRSGLATWPARLAAAAMAHHARTALSTTASSRPAATHQPLTRQVGAEGAEWSGLSALCRCVHQQPRNQTLTKNCCTHWAGRC